jgi:hypothetical protein
VRAPIPPHPAKLGPSRIGSPHPAVAQRMDDRAVGDPVALFEDTHFDLGDGESFTALKDAWIKIVSGQGIDWSDTSKPAKLVFLGMLLEALPRSRILRDLIVDIAGEPMGLKYVEIRAVEGRTGQLVIDSFKFSTLNLGDLAFFPATPHHETPWEMTRAEQIVHVLAERRYFYKTFPQEQVDLLRFRGEPQKLRAQSFARCHRYAITQHNAYRVEQGQPAEAPDQSTGAQGGLWKTTYLDGHTQTIKLGDNEQPLESSFT